MQSKSLKQPNQIWNKSVQIPQIYQNQEEIWKKTPAPMHSLALFLWPYVLRSMYVCHTFFPAEVHLVSTKCSPNPSNNRIRFGINQSRSLKSIKIKKRFGRKRQPDALPCFIRARFRTSDSKMCSSMLGTKAATTTRSNARGRSGVVRRRFSWWSYLVSAHCILLPPVILFLTTSFHFHVVQAQAHPETSDDKKVNTAAATDRIQLIKQAKGAHGGAGGGNNVGAALHLPIDEPPPIPPPPFDTSRFLCLTEKNFVPTFRSMLDDISATEDVILCLIVIYSPDCSHCQPFLQTLDEVSRLLDEEYDNTVTTRWAESSWANTDDNALLPRPIVAKLDGSLVTEDFKDKMKPLSGYPTLKFALARRDDVARGDDKSKDGDTDAAESGVLVDIFDYIGPSVEGGEFTGDNMNGIVESIWHYWYRFVAARRMATTLESIQPQPQQPPPQEVKDLPSLEYAPVFVAPSESSVVSFLHGHGDVILRPVNNHVPLHLKDEEMKYVESLLQPSSEDEEAGLAEPITIFVQCRKQPTHFWTTGENKVYAKFDGLAEELVNRRDIAFFAIQSCAAELGWFNDDDDESTSAEDGSIRVIKHVRKATTTIQEGDISALYVPPQEKDARDNMIQFIIIHSTPTLLWFDRNIVANYAFPIYRKIHAVLFIDMPEFGSHTAGGGGDRQKPKSDLKIIEQSRHAIDLFRKAADSHRRNHPTHDVVFLIVPSYEIKVLHTFGIDIWSGVDRRFSSAQGVVGEGDEEEEQRQSCDAENDVLPTVMLTSRTRPDGQARVVTKRYYLPASDIVYGNNENDDKTSESEGNAIRHFIDDFFSGELKPAIQSQQTPSNRTNNSGVQVLTGNTFESLVLDQKDKHTLIHFFAPTCGHCKRFNVVWNELARLIRALKWEGIVDVMKMDLTRNELPLDNLYIWEYPSVYYFPANDKGKPVPMRVEDGNAMYGDADLRGYDLVEWLIKQRKFDESELLHLHRIGSSVDGSDGRGDGRGSGDDSDDGGGGV